MKNHLLFGPIKGQRRATRKGKVKVTGNKKQKTKRINQKDINKKLEKRPKSIREGKRKTDRRIPVFPRNLATNTGKIFFQNSSRSASTREVVFVFPLHFNYIVTIASVRERFTHAWR